MYVTNKTDNGISSSFLVQRTARLADTGTWSDKSVGSPTVIMGVIFDLCNTKSRLLDTVVL